MAGIKSRQQRELERRKKAKKNRSQLLGATQQGQRAPMQQGYTTTSVKPPPFRQSTAADDITQAGLAYKGGKGIFDWTQGTEGGYNKAGVWEAGKEPFAMPDFSGKLNQMSEGVSNLGQNLFNMEPGLGGSWTAPPPTNPTQLGTGVGEGMTFLGGDIPPTTNQLSTSTVPQGIDKLGLAGAGFGTGMSIYDMVDRGITPGNAMGLIGSLGVGASAFPKLAALYPALGPIGMGIGGLGALGSLFDLW